jgi:hypothetical protein
VHNAPAINNAILGNSIFSNAGLGIDLEYDGDPNCVEPNVHCDPGPGPNDLQNYPVITSAISGGGNVMLSGTLDSVASTSFHLEFFSSPACYSSGFGQGKHFLGSTVVTTDANCSATFGPVSFPLPMGDTVVTATATRLGPLAGCVTPPSGMVSWWPGDDNPNDIQDGNSGTLQNGATFAPGKVEPAAFSFDGTTNGQGVLIGNPPNLQLQDFTIDAWAKRSRTDIAGNGPSGEGGILDYGHDGYGFGILADGRLFLTMVDETAVDSGTMRVTDTSFHLVAVTKSGSTVTFYVDGVAGTPVIYNAVFAFTKNVSIGARLDVSPPTTTMLTATFAGLLDEVEVFNRALGASEIQSIVNAGSAGKCKQIELETSEFSQCVNITSIQSPTPTATPTPTRARVTPTPRPRPTLAGRPTPPPRLTPPPTASPSVTPAPRPTPPPRLTPPPTPTGSPRPTPAPRP